MVFHTDGQLVILAGLMLVLVALVMVQLLVMVLVMVPRWYWVFLHFVLAKFPTLIFSATQQKQD